MRSARRALFAIELVLGIVVVLIDAAIIRGWWLIAIALILHH